MTGRRVGRRKHPSAPSQSTTPQGVLRLDGVELVAGRTYQVIARGLRVYGTNFSTTMRIEIRYAIGRAATSQDPPIEGAVAYVPVGESATLDVLHTERVGGSGSFLLCFAREAGWDPVFLDAAEGGPHIELSVAEAPPSL